MRRPLILVAGLIGLALAHPAQADTTLECRAAEIGYGQETTTVWVCPPVQEVPSL